MGRAKMTEQESIWRAEEDARVLAEYQAIVNDKDRLTKAKAIAKKEANNLTKRALDMKKVSKIGGMPNVKKKIN